MGKTGRRLVQAAIAWEVEALLASPWPDRRERLMQVGWKRTWEGKRPAPPVQSPAHHTLEKWIPPGLPAMRWTLKVAWSAFTGGNPPKWQREA